MPIPIGLLLAGGAAAFGSNIATNLINRQNISDTNAANAAITAENNRFQYQMFKEQLEENRRYFDDTNVYNSAAAQVQRLKDAGLNPSLSLYSGVDAGTAQAMSAPSAPHLQSPTMLPFQMNDPFKGSIDTVMAAGQALSSLGDAQVNLGTVGERIKNATLQNLLVDTNSKLISAKYDTEVYNAIIKRVEAKFNETPEYWNQKISNALYETVNKTVSAELFKDTAKLNLDLLKHHVKTAFHDSMIAELNESEAKVIKGLYGQLDNWTGEAAPVLANVASYILKLLLTAARHK